MSSLILKQKHRRYTILSVICILPALLTAVAAGVEWVTSSRIASVFLEFLLSRNTVWLQVFWLLLPLISFYLGFRAYDRGTIDRWRGLNKLTFYTAATLFFIVVIGGITLTVIN
jgi:ABC-type proline/glycine betaine transport system permease subunit